MAMQDSLKNIMDWIDDRLPVTGDVLRCPIDQVQQDGTALNMTKKPIAQPPSFVSTFNQPRDIGNHELHLVNSDDAKVRVQRRERVIRDFRPGVRSCGEECRFPSVRKA